MRQVKVVNVIELSIRHDDDHEDQQDVQLFGDRCVAQRYAVAIFADNLCFRRGHGERAVSRASAYPSPQPCKRITAIANHRERAMRETSVAQHEAQPDENADPGECGEQVAEDEPDDAPQYAYDEAENRPED